MPEHRQKTVVALGVIALVLATSAALLLASNVRAAGQSGANSKVGQGLGNAKPIVIDAQPQPDKDVHLNSGWKLFLVGTNTYEELPKKYDLHYAVKDVEDLRSQFIKLGVPEENITILTSEERGKSSSKQKNIQRAFGVFVDNLGPNDSAFVYLSGHGFRFKNDESAYYAPKDLDPEHIRDTGISIDDMLRQLENSDAKFKWMTVDACRNDPESNEKAIPRGITSEFIVAPENLPDAFVFMYGCADEQCSLESPELEQGLLTYAILEALQCDDNQAVRDASYELEFTDLIRYVQKRTDALAHLCRDASDKPFEQRPHVTCAKLPSFTLLANLRRGGLTQFQWQLIESEEDDFDNYLSHNDFGRAKDSLESLAGYYPEGEKSEHYSERKKKLEDAMQAYEENDELAQKRNEADKCLKNAQAALTSKEYASALTYIDEAIDLYNSPKYRNFRNGELTRGVKAAVNQAIIDGDTQKARSINKTLAELDPDVAKRNENSIVALEQPELPAGKLNSLTIAGVNVNFHWAPPGTFQMGSPKNESKRRSDETKHEVMLTQGFWIAETETTQELWEAVMGKHSRFYEGPKSWPANSLTWYECRDFVDKLNRSYSNVLPRGYKYAMPTEAQWEYACRAGTKTAYNFGSTLDGKRYNGLELYSSDADSGKESTSFPMPVKSFEPNAWGLYDMHGNVSEWCEDWYDENFYTSSSSTTDPTGPLSGSARVLRGGCCGNSAEYCRSAKRFNSEPGYRMCVNPDWQIENYGFRLVLVLGSPQDTQADEPEETRKAGARKPLDIADIEVNFIWAPPGTFMMGSPESEKSLVVYNDKSEELLHLPEENQHEVTLTKGFWIAETETTQELWQAVMGNNPSEHIGSKQLPVEKVSWIDCREFVNKLNDSYRSALPRGYKYAMPTEEQWEYACRACTTTPFSFGSKCDPDKANCLNLGPYATESKSDSKYEPTTVGSYPPNPWGLYDMHGNVHEWCADRLDYKVASRYESTMEELYIRFSEFVIYNSVIILGNYNPVISIIDYLDSGTLRIVRGGAFIWSSDWCRSAYRSYRGSDFKLGEIGFRLVLVRDSSVQTPAAQDLDDSQEVFEDDIDFLSEEGVDDVVAEFDNDSEISNIDKEPNAREAGALKTLKIAGVKVNFHWAPAGTFLMGSPESEEERNTNETQHEVTLTKGFWIAETETTQELWLAVMNNNPSHFASSNQLPVDKVSWQDCQEFIRKLNSSYSSALPSGYKYALPTEAQWEYACRAGTQTAFNFGDSLNGDKANCDGTKPYGTEIQGEFLRKTTKVKSYPPNAWNLYDMHGNVYEWCADRFALYDTSSSSTKDPTGPSSGVHRVLRGGALVHSAKLCRSACRTGGEPDVLVPGLGFRLVLVP